MSDETMGETMAREAAESQGHKYYSRSEYEENLQRARDAVRIEEKPVDSPEMSMEANNNELAEHTAKMMLGTSIENFLGQIDAYQDELRDSLALSNLAGTLRASQIERVARKTLTSDEIVLAGTTRTKLQEMCNLCDDDRTKTLEMTRKNEESRTKQWLGRNTY